MIEVEFSTLVIIALVFLIIGIFIGASLARPIIH
jgi:hypothetical protein